MENIKKNLLSKKMILTAVYLILAVVAVSSCAVLGAVNPIIAGFVLVLYAIAGYFFIVYCVAERNWLDIRAVFHAAWLGTLGLAALKLTAYQRPWQAKTWVLVTVAYVLFQTGAGFGILFVGRNYDKFKKKTENFHIGRVHFSLKENRMFWVCVITTLIGLTCFILSIAIRGFVPCFSKSVTAYVDFYTKFHIFSVASTMVSGLCFYCIRTQKLSLAKNIVLGLCILYSVFIFPIMVVSRGVFIVAALSLVTAIFYTCGKRLWVLCLSVVLIMTVYLGVSRLRNYTDSQLNSLFEPVEVEIEDENDDEKEGTTSFQLSPKMAFLYGYLTVSHDNFDLAVKNAENYTFGARQMIPFNVILRIDTINQAVKEGEYYLVRPHLNTVNIIGDAYYDFHELGIIIFALLWSFVFGIMQAYSHKSKGIFSIMTLGNAMAPITLCFFSNWMSIFTQWMFWGTVFLFFIACTVCLKPKSEKE